MLMQKLIRYRFKTNAIDDYRPLIDMADIKMPWWCTGTAGDESYVIIVCYLPVDEDLHKYWDDAYDIEETEEEEIKYSGRFPAPEWTFKEVRNRPDNCTECTHFKDCAVLIGSDSCVKKWMKVN